MTPRTVREQIAGPAGAIECAVDRPAGAPRGLAVVCHPHPQFGGTLDNKVVQTVARACLELGWASVRFNFRGVGGSEGAWDEGRGEVDDALAVLSAWRARDDFAARPFLLAGFSFGGFVAVEAAHRLHPDSKPRRLILVGPSTEKQQVADVPADTLIIHGEVDDVVPLAATLAWARPQHLPVIVFPGVGHFFHGQLALLKKTIVRELHDLAAV
jgi:alpha/beta superfamily hydrolase